MRKNWFLIFSIIILIAGISASCTSGLKAVNRESYGTATLTPFLVKATYTSESPPLGIALDEELANSSLTPVFESSGLEETIQGPSTLEPSPTPTSESTFSTDLPQPSATSESTDPSATVKPTKVPATTAPTIPPATPKPTTPPPPTAPPTAPPTTIPTTIPSAIPTEDSCVFSGNSGFENDVVALINQKRANNGLPALIQNSRLTSAARRHSEDMACTDTWSHIGSDGSNPGQRITEAGYSWTWYAENIAASTAENFTAEAVVNMWMNSDGHRANILSPNAVHIGVGFRYADNGGYDAYYTADFGRP